MLSQLGPLFKTMLRQAESTDTRLAIRRDEKHDDRRDGDEAREEAQDDSLWQDSAAVSITALHAFLIEFLKGRGEAPPEQAEPEGRDALLMPAPEYRPPATVTAARAVRAYGAAAIEPAAPPPAVPPSTGNESVDLASLLQADEIRTIYQLIRELDILAARGVQTLTIERADTFLEALVAAVAAEKSR